MLTNDVLTKLTVPKPGPHTTRLPNKSASYQRSTYRRRQEAPGIEGDEGLAMQAETYDMFTSAISEIANGPSVNSFHNLTKSLLARLAEKGLTLEQCADRRMLNRSVSTLQAHCREYGIRFPDYTPSNMRKHVQFVPSGDYLILNGPEVETVARILEIVVTKRAGEEQCSIPDHGFVDAKEALKAHGYNAKKGKAPKKAKAVANA